MASNVTGLNRTIKALRAADKLSDMDEAIIAAAKGLAAAVDADRNNAALWREYRAAVATLVEAGADSDADDDDAKSFLGSIRTPLRAAVGNTA